MGALVSHYKCVDIVSTQPDHGELQTNTIHPNQVSLPPLLQTIILNPFEICLKI